MLSRFDDSHIQFAEDAVRAVEAAKDDDALDSSDDEANDGTSDHEEAPPKPSNKNSRPRTVQGKEITGRKRSGRVKAAKPADSPAETTEISEDSVEPIPIEADARLNTRLENHKVLSHIA